MGTNYLNMSYKERSALANNPLTKDLLAIMMAKKTNLCVAADVTKQAELLSLAEEIGPYICILKLHIDILEDFDSNLPQKLTQLAHKHNFILFEDRKFADIGNTVQQQYEKGIYKISSWAQLVNAHSVPGDGIIDGLQKVVKNRADRALILIAEMSSKGNLCTPEYTQATLEMANNHTDFVTGFISMHNVSRNPAMLHLTPGVQFVAKGDGLGQQYRDPKEAILDGSDIIIVGRGITHANNKPLAAKQYQQAGWDAYLERTNQIVNNISVRPK